MDFYEVLKLRHSERKFTEGSIDRRVVDYIINCAYTAPVAKGRYSNYRLIVVEEKKLSTYQQLLKEKNGIDNTFGGSCVIFLVNKDTTVETSLVHQDAGCILNTIHLAATSVNLGSTYVYSVVRVHKRLPELNEFLGIKDTEELLGCVTIGKYELHENSNLHKIETEYLK